MTPSGRAVKVVPTGDVVSSLAIGPRSMKHDGLHMLYVANAKSGRSLDWKSDLVATLVRENSCTLLACYGAKKVFVPANS
jgi:hypothetical protein